MSSTNRGKNRQPANHGVAKTWGDILALDESKPNKDRLESLPKHLRGPAQNRHGGHQTRKIKPLKGSKFGPASEGRSLSKEEIEKFESDLRSKGLL